MAKQRGVKGGIHPADVRNPQIKVKVTQEIIDSATRANSSSCMVADALKETLQTRFKRKAFGVSVDAQTAREKGAKRRASELHVDGTTKSGAPVSQREVRTKVGGKAPPRSHILGNNRQFGLRSLGDLMKMDR